jgi:hypothetical protein
MIIRGDFIDVECRHGIVAFSSLCWASSASSVCAPTYWCTDKCVRQAARKHAVIYLGCYLAIGVCAVIAVLIHQWISKRSAPPSLSDAIRKNATFRERIIDDVIPDVGGGLLLIVAWPLASLILLKQKFRENDGSALIAKWLGRPAPSPSSQSLVETFIDGLNHVYGLDIHASMVEKAPEPLSVFVERHGPPLFSEIYKGLTIFMWAWQEQEFKRPSDLAYGNLYVADVGKCRMVFRRNAPNQLIVD